MTNIFANKFSVIRVAGGAYILTSPDARELIFPGITELNRHLKRYALLQQAVDQREEARHATAQPAHEPHPGNGKDRDR